jgi:hypothetical protein
MLYGTGAGRRHDEDMRAIRSMSRISDSSEIRSGCCVGIPRAAAPKTDLACCGIRLGQSGANARFVETASLSSGSSSGVCARKPRTVAMKTMHRFVATTFYCGSSLMHDGVTGASRRLFKQKYGGCSQIIIVAAVRREQAFVRCNSLPGLALFKSKRAVPSNNRMQPTSQSSLRSRWLAADAER